MNTTNRENDMQLKSGLRKSGAKGIIIRNNSIGLTDEQVMIFEEAISENKKANIAYMKLKVILDKNNTYSIGRDKIKINK